MSEKTPQAIVPKVQISRGDQHKVSDFKGQPEAEVPRVILRRGDHMKVDTSKVQGQLTSDEQIYRPQEKRGENRIEHPRSADEFNQLESFGEEVGDFSFQDFYRDQVKKLAKDPQRRAAFQTDFQCQMLAALVDLQIHAELRIGKGVAPIDVDVKADQ